MKALLITACGCSRMLDVPDHALQWVLPLQRPLSLFSSSEVVDPPHRMFERVSGVQKVNGIEIVVFREKL